METNKIKYNIIQQYLEGKLDPKDMHELEKQALEDPFLAEAIEGYSAADPSAGKNLSLLQRQLEERVARQQENKNIFYFTWQRLSVAAAAGLLFISAGILFWMKGHRSGDHVARQKHVEVKLTPADSLGLDRSTPVVPERIDTTIAAEIEVGTMGTLGERSRLKKQEALLNDGNRAISVLPQAAKDSLRKSLETGPVTLAASSANVDKRTASVADDDTLKSFAGRSRLNTALPGVSNAHSKGTISGKVVSMDDGRALSDVSVKSERSGISVLTNHEGEFVLPDSTGGNVAFAADGFESQIRNAEAGTQLSVSMKPVKKAAVTMGSPAQKPLKPEPVTGWTKYKTYLKENIRLPRASRLNGNVVLRFKVNSSGILSSFTIEKGLNEACNKEAIRLVEEGPAWRPSAVKEEEEVRLSILFSK